jgi:hypothetical protein
MAWARSAARGGAVADGVPGTFGGPPHHLHAELLDPVLDLLLAIVTPSLHTVDVPARDVVAKMRQPVASPNAPS